ncbi:MAG: hypothetical protein RMY64_13955 [Nostoc sp. DedQUE08]|uniref:hypothetical protein n=1 Tax=unclassified Nostoc TaxID=2593658 RepID=UPI002AD3BEA6|nr:MULTISPECIES: hypothetical protein [unclassified Nostoc]MDZ8066703.1 hypothetical protein [Nostoc sp. DedQUE08]MDZ8093481.1 hypothetical protein [Nostoc sp. DedQUE05]MDZ8129944.1 hypothetical protein [Nostoc sp. DedQUE07]MDZ8138535.1 hypothetical protein [Nostoc sp. DedQUE04]
MQLDHGFALNKRAIRLLCIIIVTSLLMMVIVLIAGPKFIEIDQATDTEIKQVEV